MSNHLLNHKEIRTRVYYYKVVQFDFVRICLMDIFCLDFTVNSYIFTCGIGQLNVILSAIFFFDCGKYM